MTQAISSVSKGVLKTDTKMPIAIGSLQWQQWVTENNSFRYESGYGAYTVRREKSTRGAKEYWYGYRKFQGKLHKRYIGRTEDLTLPKLEEIGEVLNLVTDASQAVTDKVKPTVETAVTDKKDGQVKELQIQINELQKQVALLQQQLEIAQQQQKESVTVTKNAVTEELQIKRDRVLNRLRVGRQSSVGKALDAFIKEISSVIR